MYEHNVGPCEQKRCFPKQGLIFYIILSLSGFHVTALLTIDCGESSMQVDTDDTCLVMNAIPRYETILGSKINYQCASLLTSLPSAKIAYCPVQICTSNGTWTNVSLSCASNECFEIGSSEQYRGKRSCTASGIPCQPWANQSPHRHMYNDSAFFSGENITEIAGYCRDPEGRYGQPWCYTSQSNIEWEHCDVPHCSSLSVNKGHCVEESASQACDFPDLNITTDNSCTDLADIPIQSTSIGAIIVFTCKSFQTKYVSERGYCPVETCETDGSWTSGSISCAGNECFKDGESSSYSGFRNCTVSGRPCVAWVDVENTIGVSFTDSESDDPENFCRDPEGLMSEPYCFVDTTGTNYESCGIQKCDEFLQTSDVCDDDDDVDDGTLSSETSTYVIETDHEKPSSIMSTEPVGKFKTSQNENMESTYSKINMDTQGGYISSSLSLSDIVTSSIKDAELLKDSTAIESSLTSTNRQDDNGGHLLITDSSSPLIANSQSEITEQSISEQQMKTTPLGSFESDKTTTQQWNKSNSSKFEGSHGQSVGIYPSTVQQPSKIIEDAITSKRYLQTSSLKSSTLFGLNATSTSTMQNVLSSEKDYQMPFSTLPNTSNLYNVTINNKSTKNYEYTNFNSDEEENSIYIKDNNKSSSNDESHSQSTGQTSVTVKNIHESDSSHVLLSTKSTDGSMSGINLTMQGKYVSKPLVYTDSVLSSMTGSYSFEGNTRIESSQINSTSKHRNNYQTLVSTSSTYATIKSEIIEASPSPQQSKYNQTRNIVSVMLNTTVAESTMEFEKTSHTRTYSFDSNGWGTDSTLYSISPSPVQSSSEIINNEGTSNIDMINSIQTLSTSHIKSASILLSNKISFSEENSGSADITSAYQASFRTLNIPTSTSILQSQSLQSITNNSKSNHYYEQNSSYILGTNRSFDIGASSVSDKDYLLSTISVSEMSVSVSYNSQSNTPGQSVSIQTYGYSTAESSVSTKSASYEDTQYSTDVSAVTSDTSDDGSTALTGGEGSDTNTDNVRSEHEKIVSYRQTDSESLLGIRTYNKKTGLQSLECARKCTRSASCHSFDTNIELGTCNMYSLTETNGQKECSNGHICYGRI